MIKRFNAHNASKVERRAKDFPCSSAIMTLAFQLITILAIKAELNLFKYHIVPKMKPTLPIVQNICRIGQLKIGRE